MYRIKGGKLSAIKTMPAIRGRRRRGGIVIRDNKTMIRLLAKDLQPQKTKNLTVWARSFVAGRKGFEPSVFSVKGRRVNRATPPTHAHCLSTNGYKTSVSFVLSPLRASLLQATKGKLPCKQSSTDPCLSSRYSVLGYALQNGDLNLL